MDRPSDHGRLPTYGQRDWSAAGDAHRGFGDARFDGDTDEPATWTLDDPIPSGPTPTDPAPFDRAPFDPAPGGDAPTDLHGSAPTVHPGAIGWGEPSGGSSTPASAAHQWGDDRWPGTPSDPYGRAWSDAGVGVVGPGSAARSDGASVASVVGGAGPALGATGAQAPDSAVGVDRPDADGAGVAEIHRAGMSAIERVRAEVEALQETAMEQTAPMPAITDPVAGLSRAEPAARTVPPQLSPYARPVPSAPASEPAADTSTQAPATIPGGDRVTAAATSKAAPAAESAPSAVAEASTTASVGPVPGALGASTSLTGVAASGVPAPPLPTRGAGLRSARRPSSGLTADQFTAVTPATGIQRRITDAAPPPENGRHGEGAPHWYTRLGWALTLLFTWFLTGLQQTLCAVPTDGYSKVNSMARMCYSDLPLNWTGQLAGKDFAAFPMREGFASSPVDALLQYGLRAAVAVFVPSGDTASQVQLAQGANLYTFACWVLLGLALLALGRAVLSLLERLRVPPERRAIALLALCALVLAVGMIDLQLVAVSLLVGGLAVWCSGRRVLGGVLFALAVCSDAASGWPVLALALVLVLERRHRDLGRTALGALPTLAAVIGPLLVVAPGGPKAWAVAQLDARPGLGSVWFLADAHDRHPALLGMIATLLGLASLAGLAIAVSRMPGALSPRTGQDEPGARRRPDVDAWTMVRMMAAALALAQLFAAGNSPQQVLLLAPLVLLARPDGTGVVWTAIQLWYFVAVFAYLVGDFQFGLPGAALYRIPLALVLAAHAGVAVLALRDLHGRAEGQGVWAAAPRRPAVRLARGA